MPEDPAIRAAEDAFGAEFDAPPEQAAPAADETTAVEAIETPSEEESFRGFDESVLTGLPENVAAALKAERDSMQADYTRKTQAVAERNKMFEGLDPQIARDSVAYIERLSTDPAFLVETHSEISKALQEMGLTPTQANTVATQQIEEQGYDDDDEVSSVSPQIERQLQELQAWKGQVEQERYQSYLANESLKQETAIRQQHPEYTDTDLGNIMKIGWSTGGNLLAADKVYSEMSTHFASKLLNEKSSVPSNISPPLASGTAEDAPVPSAFGGSLDKAHAAAMVRLRHMMAE